MVYYNEQLMLSPEVEALQKRYENLSDQYVKLQQEYLDLTGPTRKALETEYMMTIGRKEHALFSLQVESMQIRRELTLCQAAANQGRIITKAEVDEQLRQEFAEYKAQLDEQQKRVKEAEEHFHAEKLSTKEAQELSKRFHQIAKKLHPDIHPDLPPEAAELWNRILSAYHSGYWEAFLLFADMADELINKGACKLILPSSRELLEQSCAQLETKINGLKTEMQALEKKPPYCYRALLDDPA
ncbi:MAG: J domain-containing protein, partial [Lentisphaeria bacterium]|nr:J domain-containing protein [Lentisphaeria bacterium]